MSEDKEESKKNKSNYKKTPHRKSSDNAENTQPSSDIEVYRNRSRSVVLSKAIKDKLTINYLEFEENQDILIQLSKKQRKMSNYSSGDNLGYTSREGILNWCESVLSTITLTQLEKESIFHRFSTAFDFIMEKLFLIHQEISSIDDLKKFIVTIFLLTYKLEGFAIGKITIKTLIEAFLQNLEIDLEQLQNEIIQNELKILSYLDYDPMLLDNNFFQLSFILFDLMKRETFSGMTEDQINKFEEILFEVSKIVQFSEKILFDVLPMDKAAITIFVVILYLEKNNSIEDISKRKNSFYKYLKEEIKV
ncbi:MAG: hypothetical protein MJ252_08100, partial [archaeon]|nr:hypothetical protein [archaeon]